MVGTGNGSDSPMVWLKQVETLPGDTWTTESLKHYPDGDLPGLYMSIVSIVILCDVRHLQQ